MNILVSRIPDGSYFLLGEQSLNGRVANSDRDTQTNILRISNALPFLKHVKHGKEANCPARTGSHDLEDTGYFPHMKLNQTVTHNLCISVLLSIYQSLWNKRKCLLVSNVANLTQIGINQRGCLPIWLTALKVLTSLMTCSILTLLFANAQWNFCACLLSLLLCKCICAARIGVNKEPWSGYCPVS